MSCHGNNSSVSSATADAAAQEQPPSASAQTHDMIFNADSAYQYVAQQVALGPRVPASEAHAKCVDFITSTLNAAGVDTVTLQRATVSDAYNKSLPITNIMGRINPEAADRIILVAHYDTRPWNDAEQTDAALQRPIPGANDGGSGVGVLLEIARVLGQHRPAIGVDLLFVDAEDSGISGPWGGGEDTWCLGSQYWARHQPYTASNSPRYGIVLDMVGGRGARFYREYYSESNAPSVVNKVWSMAARSGYGEYFPNETGGAIIDDHVQLVRGGIPCIDIVECNNVETGSFPPQWHTLNDDLQAIDRSTLKAVGQTVVNLVYSER